MMKKKSRVKECDELWAEAVKAKAGYICEKEDCNETKYLQAHHIIPRTNYALRYDLENSACLCRRHHLFWSHKDIIDFYGWVEDHRDVLYLQSRRYNQSKNDYEMIKIYLKQKIEEFKNEF